MTWACTASSTLYLFGAEPTKVLAVKTKPDRRFDNFYQMMSAVLHFPDKRLAFFTCSFGAADISRSTGMNKKGTLTSDPAYEDAECGSESRKSWS